MDSSDDVVDSISRVHPRNENNQTHEPAGARVRPSMVPLDPGLINSRMMTNMNEVNVDRLRVGKEDIYEMNLNRNYLDVQLI